MDNINTIYLAPGTVLHMQYRINGVLGQGGFGITYDGVDLKLNMRVAIKEYFPNPMANRQTTVSLDVTCSEYTRPLYERGMKNFLDEARNMAKFAGEDNFVSVHDYFSENNTAYIIMEFVEGQNLKQYLKQSGRLSMEVTMAIIEPVMGALEKIHAKGMIHRDVIPSNIMILPDGRVRLLDFGAARDISMETMNYTSMSAVFKQGYSPIEQLTQGMKQGPYTDIYALCATIYEMLTGNLPPSPFQRAYEGVALIPPTQLGVKISHGQESALLKGLEINGADRIQTIGELRAALFGSGLYGNYSGSGMEYAHTDYGKIALIGILAVAGTVLMIAGGLMVFRVLGRKGSGESGNSGQQTAHVDTKDEKETQQTTPSSETGQDSQNDVIDTNGGQTQEDESQGSQSSGVETGGAVSYGGRKDSGGSSDRGGESDTDSNGNGDDSGTDGNGGGSNSEGGGGGDIDVRQPTEWPDEIYNYNGHSYAFYDANEHDLGTYSAVSNFCREQGGHLAVINNEAENGYLFDLVSTNYVNTVFFGYSDENKEGNWQWDGDYSTFENWTVDEDWNLPDNGEGYGGDEDYAEFNYERGKDWLPNDGTWNDAPFMDNTSVFLCEWEYELK